MVVGVVASGRAGAQVPGDCHRERTKAGQVVPGTFRTIPKDLGGALVRPRKSTDSLAYAASPVSIVTSIPAGMVRAAPLIVMILFIGGMFGVLEESGALTAGIDRLVTATGGNVQVVVPALMVVIACGSTFLGLISEYLVLIPMMVLLAQRLGYNALFGVAIVTVAAKIGYLTSVTNPLALVVAQPLLGIPVFSGAGFRLALFVLFLPLGIWYLLRRAPAMRTGDVIADHGETTYEGLGRLDGKVALGKIRHLREEVVVKDADVRLVQPHGIENVDHLL